jgi:probable rRNA maturation factor
MPAKFYEQGIKSGLKDKHRLSAFLDELVQKHLKDVKKVQLGYIFCGDDFLLQLNKQYLNHNTLTDIITFDLSVSPDVLLGEIYISVERVKENAGQYFTTYPDELLRVIFHGALHLCGFKDKKEAEQLTMRANENACLENYRLFELPPKTA